MSRAVILSEGGWGGCEAKDPLRCTKIALSEGGPSLPPRTPPSLRMTAKSNPHRNWR